MKKFFQVTNKNAIYTGYIFPVSSVGRFYGSNEASVCVMLPSGFMDFKQSDGQFFEENATGGLRPANW